MRVRAAMLVMVAILGCNKPQPQPARVTPEQALEMERQREAKTPCTAEWQKTATPEQKKKCLEEDPIHHGLKSMQTAKPKETKP